MGMKHLFELISSISQNYFRRHRCLQKDYARQGQQHTNNLQRHPPDTPPASSNRHQHSDTPSNTPQQTPPQRQPSDPATPRHHHRRKPPPTRANTSCGKKLSCFGQTDGVDSKILSNLARIGSFNMLQEKNAFGCVWL